MVYPANWFTVTTPANLGLPGVLRPRYRSQSRATPTTLVTAIQVTTTPATTDDAALGSRHEPDRLELAGQRAGHRRRVAGEQDRGHLDGRQPGLPGRDHALRIPAQPGHGLAAWIQTSGTVGQPPFTTNTPVVDLMAAQSSIKAP